ncbi:MAG: FHA domain-containing protein, partial [Phycisphaeraceae bacterium]|nr:FHA domain-containing protein [Phycisphaeraceae bacterium]
MSSGAESQPETYLRVQDRQGKQLQVPLDEQPILIGSAPDAHLQLRAREVLDHHAEIYLDPFGQWWLRNFGSADAVALNGNNLHRDEVLESGDRFVIGRFKITYIDQTETMDAEAEFEEPADQTDKPEPAAAPAEQSEASDSGGSGLFQPVPLDLSRQDPAAQTKRIVPIGDLFGSSAAGPTVATARIDTIHLSTLSEFGHRLLETPQSSERLRMLCRLMVRSDFHGQAAVGIRLMRGNSRQEPGKLCTPQSANGGSQMPHISKALLHSLLKSGSPGFATIKTQAGKMAAVACPIRNRQRYL